ncbi:MAG: hypothetical protein JWM10_2402 [Myxococcaceae bacterium]|nr:hypothetical protein [Myxococcaceae bacterium]
MSPTVPPASERVPAAEPLPPRAERVAAVRALMGEPDPAVRHLALGIRATARRHFDRHVVPLVDATWPALHGTAFAEKLRIGACDLYASAPYTALLCAPRRPALVRVVTGAGNLLPLPRPALALLGRGAMELLGRLAYPQTHRSIALVSAFIVVVDHALDHCMPDPPALRGPRLEAVIAGRSAPDSPALALTRALAVAMADGLDRDDRAAFERAMEHVTGWIRAEVRAMCGEPDPTGLGHRLAGVEGTIEGLLFPVARYASEGTRAWMVDVSLFVQVLDDWFDYEVDARSDRATPVTTGAWTLADVDAAWRRTTAGIEALVRASGLASPRYVRFVREAYVLMMHEVMVAMAERPDA